MRVIGFDPFVPAEKIKEFGVEPCASVAEMLPKVDYLTVHTTLTPETKNLIGPKRCGCSKGARLVNCARGGIYDEAALAEGLRSGQIAGVALDVYTEEPCTKSPLFGLPGVGCTPHLAPAPWTPKTTWPSRPPSY